jgi:predicted TIM-barrel fold metal-dependent hydrolase
MSGIYPSTVPTPLDFHVHPSTAEYLEGSLGPYMADLCGHFKLDIKVRTVAEMAADYDGLRGVLLAWDAETGTGRPAVTNDWVAEVCKSYPDRFIPFASVDPHKGEAAINEARRAVNELQMRGFKFQQAAMAFAPSDRRFFPLWEELQSLGKPCLFHVGTTGLGAGTPGGGRMQLDYVRPIHMDVVAANFPDLVIICAHPAFPWQLEMNAIALHKANVHIDLSGWAPKYFPPELVAEVRGRLQDKALFGTDYPFILPGRWLREFEAYELPDDITEKVLWGNAERLLGL